MTQTLPTVTIGSEKKSVTTQDANKTFRDRLPAWMKQLPRLKFPPPNQDYQLIDQSQLRDLLANFDPAAAQKVRDDIAFLEHEVLRLFRERDFQASYEQNRYRTYQIGYIVLATIATLAGSLQALTYGASETLVPIFAFVETLVALSATFLAAVSSREPPYPNWMMARRRAESLRREYFRYLMDLPPYDVVESYKRRGMLAQRAADINRGVFPVSEEEIN